MTKKQFFKTSSLVLLMTNLLLVAFISFGPPRRPKAPKHYIIKRLEFNPKQVKEYDLLIEEHQLKRKDIHRRIKEKKQQLYALLLIDKPEEVALISHQIAQLHQQIEQQDFFHFRDIKQLCTQEQGVAFDSLVNDLASLFSRKLPPSPPN